MNATKQNRSIRRVDPTRPRPTRSVELSEYVGRPEAWGTDLGARVFAKLNVDLMGLSEGTLVPIDFAGLERSDVSFQREAIVETIRKHRPRLLFLAVNLDDADLRTNLELALEKRGEVLLLMGEDGLDVIGKRLPEEHRRTLEQVWKAGGATSAQLVREHPDTKVSTTSSRLIALWRAGLVERVEGSAASGGREHHYLPIP